MPGKMTIDSTDITHGDFMSKTQEVNVLGGDGDNISPQLSWSGAPEGTKAFAVFCYDQTRLLEAVFGTGKYSIFQ